jgi:phage gp36-like protein
MSAYLTLAEFRARSLMAGVKVDALEAVQPGFVASQLEQVSRWVDMYLAKRYRVPFTAPYPEAVRAWVARITTYRAYLRLGVDPDDAQQTLFAEDKTSAEDEVKAAADSQLGLIDLPLSDTQAGSAIALSAPLAYSEASPYVGGDVQRDAGRYEDRSRRGT